MSKGPLPRREAILELLNGQTRALHLDEMAARLHVGQHDRPGFERLLDDLATTGVIVGLAGNRFRAKQDEPRGHAVEREGTLSVNARGFGFVAAIGFDDNLYIPEDRLGGAMHGDRVLARLVSKSSRGSEGEIIRIVKRGSQKVPGVLRRRGKAVWLEPDDARVRGPIVVLAPSDGKKAIDGEDGAAAVVRITRYPELLRENPEGELEAVLGTPGDPKVEVAKTLLREEIEEAHPPDAVREAEAYGREVSPDALVGREDLTHLPLPTIDPEDARDHDDAVWGIRNPDGSYRVWIAIADVSHYVRPNTAIDQAALARGCSIYLPDRAIPMLPRALSSHLCSLLPHEVRLCMAVEADLDATGVVTSFRLLEGFMRSAAKLTYGGVARALKFTDKPERSKEAEAMLPDLKVLHDLAMLLRAQRMRRGALDFELPEVKIVLDPTTGAPVGVERRSEDPGVKKAYQLIEELMLLANELVARHLTDRGIPAIYRVHGAPDETKLDKFATMATTLGVAFDMDDAKDPKKLSQLLKRVAAHPSKDVFNMLLLRAMKQATYDTANIGHFGLASTTYLHFTSPIRRYPDLVVHRAVRALLSKKPVDKSPSALEILKASATTASERERHAMEVEREVVDLYRALYMRAYIGSTFTGKVTALVGSGVFVQLDSPFVDVLVKSEALGADHYEMDDDGMRMVGVRSGDSIALGDPMELVIEDVAILRRSIYGRRLGAAAVMTLPKGKKQGKVGSGRGADRGASGRGAAGRTASGRGGAGRSASDRGASGGGSGRGASGGGSDRGASGGGSGRGASGGGSGRGASGGGSGRGASGGSASGRAAASGGRGKPGAKGETRSKKPQTAKGKKQKKRR